MYKKIIVTTGIILSLTTEAYFGIRGIGNADRDFLSKHPFSTPMMNCTIQAIQNGIEVDLPTPLYQRIPSSNFKGSFYTEFISSYEKAIKDYVNADTVSIKCTPVYEQT